MNAELKCYFVYCKNQDGHEGYLVFATSVSKAKVWAECDEWVDRRARRVPELDKYQGEIDDFVLAKEGWPFYCTSCGIRYTPYEKDQTPQCEWCQDEFEGFLYFFYLFGYIPLASVQGLFTCRYGRVKLKQ